MSQNLFRRSWKVTIDTIDVSTIDLEFKILTSIKPHPNRCVVTVWNLNADHRGQLLKRNRPNPNPKQLVGIPVSVQAGYDGTLAQLFSGDLREVTSTRDNTDWKTTLAGDDGGRAYRESRVNQTFAKGTPYGTVLQQCCAALGIGLGNAANFTAGASITGLGSTLPHAMVLSGSASQHMSRLINSLGLTWSIQNGALQLLQKGQPLAMSAVLITPQTGLVGSPEASIDSTVSLGNPQQFAAGAKGSKHKAPKPKDPGVLKLKTLLIPGLIPGRAIHLESAAFTGDYMITEIEYVGQTWANEWTANMVVRLY